MFNAEAFDLSDALSAFDEEGVAIVTNVLLPAELQHVRDAVEEVIATDRARGEQLTGFSYDPDDRNIRIRDLVLKHEAFRALAENPLALTFVEHAMGEDFRLSNFSGNVTGPGSQRMYMHADQGFVPAPWPPYPFAINIGWAIDDFTFENGGTVYVPGSNHKSHGPAPEGGYPDEKAIECPAGSFFAIDGRTWHQTGDNLTTDQSRTGLFAYYVRPFLILQRPWYRFVSPELEGKFTPSLWNMMGMDVGEIPTLRSSKADVS
ncbi:phytanoyl-CoA dioxygenase family protein [Henriciella sp. AS95]|uniref:phytanoyl-CoA dioxygenase family protein n=1 Tax=Henriciella sp. AS95 TaxID=3135782 RepID=UPI00317D219D